jgi:hypothetical protein
LSSKLFPEPAVGEDSFLLLLSEVVLDVGTGRAFGAHAVVLDSMFAVASGEGKLTMGDAKVGVVVECIIDDGFGSEVECEGLLGILSLARCEGGWKVGDDLQCNVTSTLDVFGNPEYLEVDLASIQGCGCLGNLQERREELFRLVPDTGGTILSDVPVRVSGGGW